MALAHSRFEVYPIRRHRGRAPRWGVRFRGRNGETWAGTESYTRRRDALRSANGIRFSAGESDVVILDSKGEVIATPVETAT